jgi:hypothetical protein
MSDLTQLNRLIQAVLDDEISFDDFDRTFGFTYYELPVDVMRSEPAAFVSAVCEKREFVADEPTDAERLDGWIDRSEYMAWLREEWDRRQVRPAL